MAEVIPTELVPEAITEVVEVGTVEVEESHRLGQRRDGPDRTGDQIHRSAREGQPVGGGTFVYIPRGPSMALNGTSSRLVLNDRAYALTGPAKMITPTLRLPTDASESTWAPTGINQLLAEPDAAKVVLLMISLSAARACQQSQSACHQLQWPDRTPRANRVVEDLLDAMGRSAMATSFAGLGDQRNPRNPQLSLRGLSLHIWRSPTGQRIRLRLHEAATATPQLTFASNPLQMERRNRNPA